MLRAGGQVLLEGEHGSATGAPSLCFCHPPTVGAVATARRMVSGFLATSLPEHVVRVAVLLTSELVTNAVVHATTPFRLDVMTGEDVVRVAVSDGDPGLAAPARPLDAAEHGRGLLLVDALSTSWGSECLDGGKQVWFELAARPA